MENKQYLIDDIVAIMIPHKNKAISGKVVMDGIIKTKSGTTISFEDEQVLWILGLNGKWPSFVHKAFRGEEEWAAYNKAKQASKSEKQKANDIKTQYFTKYSKSQIKDAFKQDKFGKTKEKNSKRKYINKIGG